MNQDLSFDDPVTASIDHIPDLPPARPPNPTPSSPPTASLEALQAAFGSNVQILPLQDGPDGLQLADGLTLAQAQYAAVACGPSTGLLALMFGIEAEGRQFLSSNAILADTLVTRFNHWLVVWLRPTNRSLPNVTLGNTNIVWGTLAPVFAQPGSEATCSIVQAGHPLQLPLQQLRFTGRLERLFADVFLREQFGLPILKVGRRQQLNPVYFAARFSKLMGLRYHKTKEAFLMRDLATGADVLLAADKLPRLIVAMLQDVNQSGLAIPASEFAPKRVLAIVEALKTYFVVSTSSNSEMLDEFLQLGIEQRAGASLTVNELATAFQGYRKSLGLPPCSDNLLRRDLKRRIAERFGVRESHDIPRVGMGGQRGFHGLGARRLEPSSPPSPSTTLPSCGSINGEPQPAPAPPPQQAETPTAPLVSAADELGHDRSSRTPRTP